MTIKILKGSIFVIVIVFLIDVFLIEDKKDYLIMCDLDQGLFKSTKIEIMDNTVVSFEDKSLEQNYNITYEINYLNDYIEEHSVKKLIKHIQETNRYRDCEVY